MPSAITNAISVVGGAALGAAAMYLLDPDNGADRRSDVSDSAADAVAATRSAARTTAAGAADGTRSARQTIGRYASSVGSSVSDHVSDASDAVQSGASSVAGKAQTIASRIAAYAKELAGHVSHHASDAADHVSDATDSAVGAVKSAHKQTRQTLADAYDSAVSYATGRAKKAKATTDDWFDDAADHVDHAKRAAQSKARKAAGMPEPHPVGYATGITAGSIAVLALGAGLMYYMDPERGRSRRAVLRDKLYSTARQSGNKARAYGHHLGNKATGYAYQAKAAVPQGWVDKARSAVGSDETSTTSA